MNIIGQNKQILKENLEIPQSTTETTKEKSVEELVANISRMLDQLQLSVEDNLVLNSGEQKTFSDWFGYMESLSRKGVSDVHKQELLVIKAQLEKGQDSVVFSKQNLQVFKSAIESISTFTSQQLDEEKTKELEAGLSSFDQGLHQLEQSINQKKAEAVISKEAVLKELEEKKREATQKAADEFVAETQKTRWGRAANKVFDIRGYIQDKYIDKKPIGRVKEYLAGAVLGLLGFKALKDKMLQIQIMKPDLSKIEVPNIKVPTNIEDEVQKRLAEEKAKEAEKIAAVEKVAEDEREKIAEQILKPKYREALSIKGPIDEGTWDKIWKKRYAGNKDIVLQHAENIKQDYKLAQEDKQRFHTLGYVLETIAIPAKSFWELFTICKEEGVLEPSDVVASSAFKGGKQIFQLGIKSTSFLGNSFMALTGAVSLEEVAKSISEVNIDRDSRMALWGVLYRHGGLFHSLLGKMADISGAMLSTYMQSGVEREKMTAYLKGGIMADTKKQIDEFKKFEQTLRESGVFKGSLPQHGGADLLDDMLDTMTVSADAVRLAKTLGTGSDADFEKFKKAMSDISPQHKQFADDIEASFKNVDRTGSGFDYRKYMKDTMKSWTESVTTGLSKGRLASMVDTVMKYISPTFNASFRSDAKKIMENMTNSLAETLVTKDEWIPRKLLWNNSKFGSQLAETVEFRHKLSFYAKTPQDLKDIREKLEYMASKAPNMLGSLVHHAPVILVGKEVTDAIQAGGSVGMEITKGFASLAPIIGPVYLMNDAVSWQSSKPVDLEKATLSVMILAQDTWVTLSTKGNQSGRQWLASTLMKPVTSTMGMTSNAIGWTYQTLKMATIDMPKLYGQTIIKEMAHYKGAQKAAAIATGTLKFAGSAVKESAILSGKAGLKIAGLAALAYGGYYYVNKFIDDRTGSTAEREQIKKIQEVYETTSAPHSAHEKLRTMYKAIEKTADKEQFLRHWIQVALSKRLGMADLTGVEVGNVTSDPITVSLKEFRDKGQRDAAGQDIATSLADLLGKEKVSITFNYEGKLLQESYAYLKESFIKEGKSDDEASKLALESYKKSLQESGESESTITSIVSKLK